MKKAVKISLLSAFLLTFTVTKQVNAMQDTEEIWKPIDGFNSLYQISNFGRIKNVKRGTYKTPIKNWAGYMRVQLCMNDSGKIFSIHRLVAINFIPNPNNLPEVNHINHDRSNNHVSNLEWCTRSYNAKHSFTREGRKIARAWLGKNGSLHHASKAVIQYKDGKEIAKFGSIAEAGRVLSIKASSIGRCCSGERKSYKGFNWEFI